MPDGGNREKRKAKEFDSFHPTLFPSRASLSRFFKTSELKEFLQLLLRSFPVASRHDFNW